MPFMQLNKRGQIVIEILVGLIFIVLLIMLVFLFTSPALTGKTISSKSKTSATSSSASSHVKQQYCETIKVPYQTTETYVDKDSYYYKNYKHYEDYDYKYYSDKDYRYYDIDYRNNRYCDDYRGCYYIDYDDTCLYRSSYRYLTYKDWADHDRDSGVFGSTIDKYVVYVENTDNKAGYFNVNFYLRDCYSETTTKSVRHYIQPNEQAKFLYQDYHRDENRYCGWDYEVVPDTKTIYLEYDRDNCDRYRKYDGYKVYYNEPIIKTRTVTKYRTEKICYWK